MTREEEGLVADRACGDCNICCIALTIDDEALRKPQGIRCRHAARDNGCSIYDRRPGTCRTFYCGWRRYRWVSPRLRPDLSGVLIREHVEIERAGGHESWGIAVMLLNARAIAADGLAETVAAAVHAGRRVYLNIPGRPGFTAASARVDEALAAAVLLRDKARVLEILSQARGVALRGRRQRITFAKR